jgi:hypothetical protein
MSPDIEWRVGEEAEQETIARTSNVRRSRRSRWAVIMAIGLGVSLALLYRAIPEPPAKPIGPTPAPTVMASPQPAQSALQSLDSALQRDALRLATAARGVSFDPALGRMPQAYADWYAALQNALGRWEPEAAESLITVYETGTLPSGVVWAKLGQFRQGDFYRHTRFYRQQDDDWIWTLPDWSFWQGATAAVMTGDAGTIGPITIGHPIEEAPVIGAVFDRFTRAYFNLCESLNCPPRADPALLWTPGLTLSITIEPLSMQPAVRERSGTLSIALPSPRVVGYYEDANSPGDPYVAMAYATLIDPVVRLASGDYARWETKRGGELFLQAIALWKRARLREVLRPLELFYDPVTLAPSSTRSPTGELISQRPDYVRLLQTNQRLPLDAVWNWETRSESFGLLEYAAVNEAQAVIIFLEDRFGTEGVVQFLNALGRANSLEEAIEAALPIDYGEFLRQWRVWSSRE